MSPPPQNQRRQCTKQPRQCYSFDANTIPKRLYSSTPHYSTSSSSDASFHTNVISSPKSATVKKVQALMSKRKKRTEFNQAVVEGPRMVFDLLKNPTTKPLVQQVLVSTDFYHDMDRPEMLLLFSSDDGDDNDTGPHVQLVLPEILKKACSDTVSPQGIVAIVDIPQFDLTQTEDDKKEYPFHLVLDGVSDPGNLGTLLRSSLAVGVTSVVLLPGCCDVWNPKAIRSAMGASFQVPIVQASSWNNALESLQQDDDYSSSRRRPVQRVFAATMLEGDDENTSVPHFDVNWIDQPTALVIGSEGNGLSLELREQIELGKIRAAHVPMQYGIESLNAAVCGSVFLFEYQRQCELETRKEKYDE